MRFVEWCLYSIAAFLTGVWLGTMVSGMWFLIRLLCL